MTELILTGLDGKNPIGFLAALGVLAALEECGGEVATLSWRLLGTYRPVLHGAPARAELIDLLDRDRKAFADEPALALRYVNAKGADAHDLKPPPLDFIQRYLKPLVERGSRRSLGFAAAFATDVATDNNGSTKPTALHFTAGNQEFLGMVQKLIEGVVPADLEEALFGPWRYARPLPVLQWDNAISRDYALRASDPSKDKKLGVPGADWLAFRGIPFVRVAPVRGRGGAAAIATVGCSGGWKDGSFRWPLWSVPLGRSVIAALLASVELFEADRARLRARGIDVVLESDIRRHDQGGYGAFSPSRVAAPPRLAPATPKRP